MGEINLVNKQTVVNKLQTELDELRKLDNYQVEIDLTKCKMSWLEYYQVLNTIEDATTKMNQFIQSKEALLSGIVEIQEKMESLGTVLHRDNELDVLLKTKEQTRIDLDSKTKELAQKEGESNIIDMEMKECDHDRRTMMTRVNKVQIEVCSYLY